MTVKIFRESSMFRGLLELTLTEFKCYLKSLISSLYYPFLLEAQHLIKLVTKITFAQIPLAIQQFTLFQNQAIFKRTLPPSLSFSLVKEFKISIAKANFKFLSQPLKALCQFQIHSCQQICEAFVTSFLLISLFTFRKNQVKSSLLQLLFD